MLEKKFYDYYNRVSLREKTGKCVCYFRKELFDISLAKVRFTYPLGEAAI